MTAGERTRLHIDPGPTPNPDYWIKVLKTGDQSARLLAVQVLGFLGPEATGAAPHLLHALRDFDDIAEAAAKALWTVPADPLTAGAAMLDEIRRRHAEDRRRAAEWEKNDWPIGIGIGPDVSDHIADALSKLGPPVVPLLVRAFEDEDSCVRLDALSALMDMEGGAELAVHALYKLSRSDPNGTIRELATMTIDRMGKTQRE